MDRVEISRSGTDDGLAQAAATQWIELLGASAAKPFSSVALSGGRIARKFFSAVSKTPAARQNLDRVHFFWGDERCVPPNDPESNFGMANELLFAPLKIPAAQIHRIQGELPPEQAASEAQAELKRLIVSGENGLPILDLIFLGMGEDGHVASLFPGEPESARNNPAIFRPVVASKPPPHRITLGYGGIIAAREVWVLASGAGKEQALRSSLSPDGQTPLARVLQRRHHTKIFTELKV
jgi:6-phosphogluconolactonase